MWKGIVALVAGLFTGNVVMFMVQGVSLALYPMPDGVDPTVDQAAFEAYVASLPLGAYLLVLFAWAAGTGAGAAAAGWLNDDDHLRMGLVLGSVFQLAAIVQFLTMPHPTWMQGASLLCFLPMGFLGAKLGASLAPPAEAAEPAP